MNPVPLVITGIVLAIVAYVAWLEIRAWGWEKFIGGIVEISALGIGWVFTGLVILLYIALGIGIVAGAIVGIGYLARVGWNLGR